MQQNKTINLKLLDYEKAPNAMSNPIIKMQISFNNESKENFTHSKLQQ
ncbi:hypothetical protein OLS72_10110 [Campylobacter jejuni]|nr:hypothetical protein [Campylobacter jejuni]